MRKLLLVLKKLINRSRLLVKTSIKVFNRYYPFSLLLLLALIVILAYGQMVNLYFWTDDWDLMLKVIHPELGLWGMNPGPFGSGPYRYLHTPFLPLYPFFGLNAGPYFAVSIFIYFLTTICVYLLFLELTQKRYLAIGSAVIFASIGYIGSYTMFHISNSYQNLGSVIFCTLTLWILARHYRTRSLFFYFLSLGLFWASLEFENLRSHGLIFLVFGLLVFYEKWELKPGRLVLNLLKFAPFVFIYKTMYAATLAFRGETTVGVFFRTMIRDKTFAYFVAPLLSFSNVIVPDNISKFIFNFFNSFVPWFSSEFILTALFVLITALFLRKRKINLFFGCFLILFEIGYYFFNQWAFKQTILFDFKPVDRFISMLGMTLFLSFTLLALNLWRKKNQFSRLVLFAVILIFGNYIGYFVGIPAYSFLATTERYLTPSTVGTALLLGVIFSLIRLRKKNMTIFLSTAYCLYLIVTMNMVVYNVVTNISKPNKQFYQTIKKIAPSIPAKAVLLFDYENDPNLRYRINSTFPSTAFALLNGFAYRVPSVYSLDELLYNIKNGKTTIDNITSFYISSNEVVNTSPKIQKLLSIPSAPLAINLSGAEATTPYTNSGLKLTTETLVAPQEAGSVGVSPLIEAKIDYQSMVPMMLSFTLSALPKDLRQVKFPYYDITKLFDDQVNEESLKAFSFDVLDKENIDRLPCRDRLLILQSEEEREDFVSNNEIKISTTSEVQYSEKEFLKDGLFSTNWSAHSLSWYHNKKEEVVIDLGEVKNLRRFFWVNYLERRTQTEYTISVSKDNSEWMKIKEVKNGGTHLDGEVVIEELGGAQARFMKMSITNTLTNKAPAIPEIWVSTINDTGKIFYSQPIIDSPFSCPVETSQEAEDIFASLNRTVRARLWWLSNSKENYSTVYSKELEIIADGRLHTYNLYIPAQGTNLEKIKIDNFQIPVSLSLYNILIHSLTFKEIDDLGFISRPTGSPN